MDEVFDLLTISQNGGLGHLTFVIVLLIIAMYLINIFTKLSQLELWVLRRKRSKLWKVFRWYKEFNRLLFELEDEFSIHAGISPNPYRSMYFWLPSIVSVLIFVGVYYFDDVGFLKIMQRLAAFWLVVSVFMPLTALVKFDHSSFKGINGVGRFFDFSLGMLLPTYIIPFMAYPDNTEKGLTLLAFSWIFLLLVILGWFPYFKRHALLTIWYSREFLPKKKMLLTKLPYLKIKTPECTFSGRIVDVFDQEYLVIREGVRDIPIPWSKILYIEIIGGVMTK